MALIVGLVFLVAGLSAGCSTTPTVDSSAVEDRSGLDGNWVAFTNRFGMEFWLKKDLRNGKWEVWWWPHAMPYGDHPPLLSGVIEDGQELLLYPGWQIGRTNL